MYHIKVQDSGHAYGDWIHLLRIFYGDLCEHGDGHLGFDESRKFVNHIE
jgi:hypothetical protein